jgi:hypothetical protein
MGLCLILICRSRLMSVDSSSFLYLQKMAIVSMFASVMFQAADHGCLVLPHPDHEQKDYGCSEAVLQALKNRGKGLFRIP